MSFDGQAKEDFRLLRIAGADHVFEPVRDDGEVDGTEFELARGQSHACSLRHTTGQL
jgi:hypothetical protein